MLYNTYEVPMETWRGICADCGDRAERKVDGRWLCDDCYLEMMALRDDPPERDGEE